MDFDTGSADIWIPSRRYNHIKSTSYSPVNRPFKISYGMHGSSGSVSGYLSRDTISLGNLNVREQLFAEVDTNGDLGFFAADVRFNGLFFKKQK